MKIKLPKRYYTVEQLAERWQCKIEDIEHLIDINALETVDKGAARSGKKYLRTRLYYEWGEYDAHQESGDILEEVTIPIVVSPDSGVSPEETIRHEMELLADYGEFDQVILADEVSRFEDKQNETDISDEDFTSEPSRPRTHFPTTSELSKAFDGINGWSQIAWKKNLSDPPKWIKSHMISGGGPPHQNRWNPIELAKVLMSKNKVDPDDLNNRFMKADCLKPWLSAWQPFADLIDKD